MRRIALLVALFAVSSAQAEVIGGPKEYIECLIKAKTQPIEGWEEALAWGSLGGGEAARHCGAVALMGLGKHEDAANRLEALAQESRRPESVRAEMLAQAAQAWLLAGKPEKALADQNTALGLVPGAPDLLLDRSVTYAGAGQYKDALADLDKVLRVQPNRVEAMVLRAAANRQLDKTDLAEDDVARALALDPAFPDALLERGMLRRLKGRDAEARADWMKVLELVPETSVADSARAQLEKMDVKTK